MKYIAGVLFILAVFMAGWASGEMWGSARTISTQTAREYMEARDINDGSCGDNYVIRRD